MADSMRDMTGKLWEADKRTDKSPDRTGRIVVRGEVLHVSAWQNTPRNGGKPYLSLKIETEAEAQAKRGARAPRDDEAPPPGDYDDECPF